MSNTYSSLASRSASNSNCQPWQVHVVTGAAKRTLTSALLAAHDYGGRVSTCEYNYQPKPDAVAGTISHSST